MKTNKLFTKLTVAALFFAGLLTTMDTNAQFTEQWKSRYNGPPNNNEDRARAIVVDGSGNVYVTGESVGINTNWDYATIKYSQPVTDVNEEKIIPAEFALYQNYPNPLNPGTVIKYHVPENSFVSIRVYDLLGKELVTLVNEEKSAGSYELEFNASELTSGIYFYTIKADNFVETKKMVLMK